MLLQAISMTKYLKPREAAEILGVNVRTLVRWEENKKISAIKTPSGQRRYDIDSYIQNTRNVPRKTVLYCRVSSNAQKSDLDRQVAELQNLYPNAETVQEIGGGLNFKRQKLLNLLSQICAGEVEQLIVTHQDRLALFGFDLFKWLCEQNNCDLVVLNNTELSFKSEIIEDILVILQSFSTCLPSLKKYKNQIQQDMELYSKINN